MRDIKLNLSELKPSQCSFCIRQRLFVFMDNDNFEQLQLILGILVIPKLSSSGLDVDLLFDGDEILNALAVSRGTCNSRHRTGYKGNTATGASKPAI